MKELIEEALIDIRKQLAQEGGDVEFVSFSDGVLKLRLKGACAGCPMSTMTMKNFIESYLIKRIPQIKKVESV